MTNLHQLKLIDLAPSSIKNDPQVIAISDALDKQMKEVTDLIIETVLIPRIDKLSEEVIDLLAWQFHVDFYEPLGLSLDKKRELVKNSISWHQRKGTPSVLEEILKLLFFEESEVSEWFKYGGEPYFFRITTFDRIENQQFYEELLRAIYAVKNTRSWLEMIRLLRESTLILKLGITQIPVTKTTIKYTNPDDVNLQYDLKLGISQVPTAKTTIKYTNPSDININCNLKLGVSETLWSKTAIKYINPINKDIKNNVKHEFLLITRSLYTSVSMEV